MTLLQVQVLKHFCKYWSFGERAFSLLLGKILTSFNRNLDQVKISADHWILWPLLKVKDFFSLATMMLDRKSVV